MRNKQSGLSMIGMLIVGILLALVFIVGIRCAPIITEYMSVKKILNQMVESPPAPDTPISAIRQDFDRRASADYIESVRGTDLAISRPNGNLSIGVTYERTVPLVANVSLLFEFDTQVDGSGR